MERHLSDESDDDTVQFKESDSENECLEDDDFLWEKLVIMTSISSDPLEVFEGFIDLFMQSEDDDLFNQMMDRISSAIYIYLSRLRIHSMRTMMQLLMPLVIRIKVFGLNLEKKGKIGNVNGSLGSNVSVHNVEV